MKRVIFVSLSAFAAMLVLGAIGVVYFLFGNQDRGTTADGRMAPPASVRNAPEAPKYDGKNDAVPVAERPAEYQLPNEFKIPTEMDISTPPVPEGLSAPAGGQKS